MISVAIYKEEEELGQGERRPALNVIDASKCSIGRGKHNDVVLDDPCVSREHARIYQEKDDYFICDLKSKGGTFIQGHRLPALHKIKLKTGTVITIGRKHLRLNNDNDAPKTSDPKHNKDDDRSTANADLLKNKSAE